MIRPFPQIRDEESTYSIFSRLQFERHFNNYEQIGKLLFGRRFEVGRLNFQGSFQYLCDNLPDYYTPDMFLYQHTIYPLFIPFITEEKQLQAKKYFNGNYPDLMNKCLFVSNITRKRTYIRICKECAKEDYQKYGQPIFRRQHEIELNRMCYKHKTPLYEFNILPYKIPSPYIDCYTVLNNATPINIPDNFMMQFLSISEDIDFIFTHTLDGWSKEKVKNKILRKLKEIGYTSMHNMTFQKRLGIDLKSYYTEDFLNYINYNFDTENHDNWLSYCTSRKNFASDPLKYILLIRFLFGSFKNFYEAPEKHSYFIEGNYPCLNKVCHNYKKLVIKNASEIKISNGHPLAIFKCKYCGFEYTRRGPDKNQDDIYRKTYIKDPGHLLLFKLKEYVVEGYSQRRMSKLLGISAPTVKRYIDNLNKPVAIPPKDKGPQIEKELSMVKQFKVNFVKFKKINPDVKRIYLYHNYREQYMLIYKYDKNWLHDNLSSKPIITFSLPKGDWYKQYWENKDALLSKKIIKCIEEIKQQKEVYDRITIHLIQKFSGYHNYFQNQKHLPKCFKIFDSYCETIEDFQKRRIDYATKKILENNKKVTYSKVMRIAGIRQTASKEVLDYIENKICHYMHS